MEKQIDFDFFFFFFSKLIILLDCLSIGNSSNIFKGSFLSIVPGLYHGPARGEGDEFQAPPDTLLPFRVTL